MGQLTGARDVEGNEVGSDDSGAGTATFPRTSDQVRTCWDKKRDRFLRAHRRFKLTAAGQGEYRDAGNQNEEFGEYPPRASDGLWNGRHGVLPVMVSRGSGPLSRADHHGKRAVAPDLVS